MLIKILLATSCLLSLLLGGAVVWNSASSWREKILFAGYALGIFLWSGGIFANRFFPVEIQYVFGDVPYTVMQILYMGAAFIVFFQYWFFNIYACSSFSLKWHHILSLVLFLSFGILLLIPNIFFSSIEFFPTQYAFLEREGGMHFFVFYIAFFYVASFSILWKRKKQEQNSIYKMQFRYLFWSFCVFNTLACFTNMILPTYFHAPFLNAFGPVLYVFEAGIFLYATARLRFLDLQLTTQKLATYISNAFVYLLPLFVLFALFERNGSVSLSVVMGATLFCMGAIFFAGKKTFIVFDQMWNRVLYGNALNPLQKIQEALRGFRKSISEGLQLLAQGLNVQEAQFIYAGEKQNAFAQFFTAHPNTELVREELEAKLGISPSLELRKVKREMDQYLVSVAIPVFDREQKLLGVLFLKQKLDNQLFSAQEIKETRLLLENATVYLASQEEHQNIEDRLTHPSYISKEFLNNLMHEIRTPLMMAQNVKEMIEWSRLKPEDRDFLSESEESIQELTRKLDKISEAFQWQQKIIPLEKSFILLESIFEFIERDFKNKNINIVVNIPLHLKKKLFELDISAIKMAFGEIIKNTLFFNQQKNPKVHIDISQEENQLIFRFTDNGIGIEKKYWNSVFDLLFVVAESRNVSECGLGVGLTLAKGVIESHKGNIEIIQSKKGEGTVFEIKIPCK